jgi:PadR family transcriptional regulator PadR
MDFSQDLIRGSIVPIVLSLLRERPMYGYEIVKLVNARSGGRLQWREGTLYPTLHKLESEHLLNAEWMDAPEDEAPGRKRKYYAITRNGRTELERRSREWHDFTDAVARVMAT